WDQKGQDANIILRTFDGTQFDAGVTLDNAVSSAVLSADKFFGEAAINLSQAVFPEDPTSCLTVGNILPGTITGNSDSADYKDTVLADFTEFVTISNCGSVRVTKVTDPAGLAGSFPYTLSRSGGGFVDYQTPQSTEKTGTLAGHGDSDLIHDLVTGDDYTLAENLTDPTWGVQSIVCDGNNVYPGGEAFSVVSSVTSECTITNKLQTGTLTVVKYVQNNSGGNLAAADFTVHVTRDGADVSGSPAAGSASGTVYTLLLGDYLVSEVDPTAMGYARSGFSGDCVDSNGDGVAEVTVIPDQNVTCTITNADGDPGLSLSKSGTLNDDDGTAGVSAGDTISYAFTVTNTGVLTLSNVMIDDPLITVEGGPITLDAGAADSTTFSGSYTITQADIDAGGVDNTATTSGDCPDGTNDCATATDSHSEILAQSPSIALLKSGTLNDDDSTAGVSEGDTISYAFTVTNTGNVTLTNITLADTVGGVTISGGPIASLAPGASDSSTFSGSYTVTQADIDAGTFSNTATVTGTPPSGGDVSATDDDVQTLLHSAAIDLVKTGSYQGDPAAAAVGDTVSYTFDVTNTGNVTLTSVTINDPTVTVDCGSFDGQLLPGESVTCSASTTIDQADIDAGSVLNTATATGTAPSGSEVEDQDSALVPLPQSASVDVESYTNDQDADDPTGPLILVGNAVEWTYQVTNTGNVTLYDVAVTDTMFGESSAERIRCDEDNVIAVLAPGEVVWCAAFGTAEAGQFSNTGTAEGSPTPSAQQLSLLAAQETVTDSDPSHCFGVELAIELVKEGSLDMGADGVATPGDLIHYTFTVTNTGNMELTAVTVTDPLVAVSGGPVALAAGQVDSSTFTASYAITQADIDAGVVDNTASASGSSSLGPDVSAEDSHSEPIPQAPSILLEKTGTFQDENGDGAAQAGETISYAFTITNTGNVTLANVSISDPDAVMSGGPLASLAPGASDATTFTGSYVITQADIDAGTFTNTATATGTDPNGDPTSDDDSHTEALPQDAVLSIVKTGSWFDANGDGDADAGETIDYEFLVSNDGNVTLTNISVTDPLVSEISCPSGNPISLLAPGASESCTGSYTLSQDDVDAGERDNTATADSDQTDPVSDDETVVLPQNPSIAIVKSGEFQDEDGDGLAQPGETIGYTFIVTNTGNVSLTNVTVTDPLPGLSAISFDGGDSDGDGELDVDETWTYSASYTVTQGDIDAGSVENLATADSDESDPADDGHNEPLPGNVSLTISKEAVDVGSDGVLGTDDVTASNEQMVAPGGIAAFTIIVTNDGNKTAFGA
ncbi:MAG: DUF11 domain-containing protein, partial [Trueperaceae bacterium]